MADEHNQDKALTVPTIDEEKTEYSIKLERLIDHAGSQRRLALILDVSAYNISNWLRRGVSRNRQQLISSAYRAMISKGSPTRESLRDIRDSQ